MSAGTAPGCWVDTCMADGEVLVHLSTDPVESIDLCVEHARQAARVNPSAWTCECVLCVSLRAALNGGEPT